MPARRGLTGAFWPSDLQQGLLTAALGDRDDAVGAWQALAPGFVLDDLEPGCFDVMALVYRQLSAAGYNDAIVERLKSIYRREWVRATVLRERTKEIAANLRAAEIEALFIEGTPLAERYFPAAGLRPSWFVDVFLREPAVHPAVASLAEAGWSSTSATIDTRASNRWALMDADRNVCVLRTSLSDDFVSPSAIGGAYRPLWEAVQTYDLDGTPIFVPDPAWALLAVCVFGARWHPRTNLQWIVDAVMILRKERIDFARLLDVARTRGQVMRLREAVTYVCSYPGVQFPDSARAVLDEERISPRDRLAFTLAAGSIRSAGSLPALAAKHLATSDASLAGAVASFPAYVRREWNVTRGWELPYAAGQRAVRRLRARGRGV